MFDKILQISLLYDFYGQLLTKKQQEVLQLYYSYDLSLGEISEQLGVSRQAIYDIIKRTEKLLFEYEKKLGLVHKFICTKDDVQRILKIVEDIQKDQSILNINNNFLLEELKKIKDISNHILEN